MEVIDSVEREADGGERAREPAPIRLRHGGGTQRSACSQTSRGSCGRNRKGVTAGTERHCKSVHTRRYAVRLARRECVSASEGRARGRTAAAGMVPGMAGMVPFSWCGTSGGVSTLYTCKKKCPFRSGFSGYKCTMAVQMLENMSCFVWRGCGFATVRSQRQNPSTAHNLHPEFDHFQKRLAFAVDTGQAHGISPRVHDTAYMLRFVPGGTPDEFCHTSSTQ